MTRVLGLALCLSFVALGACGGDDDDDTVPTADAAPSADANPNAPDASAGCTAAFANCAEADFMDISASVNPTPFQIDLAGSSYSPKCLRVKVGQMVIIPADAAANHPVKAAACNPDFIQQSSTDVTVTMDTPGDFGYLCAVHQFKGLIEVVP